jgi:hypothetical protein
VRVARMGEGLGQQQRIAEFVPDLLFKRMHGVVVRANGPAVFGKPRSR